ncbi:hypothetical protein [Spartinivicinus ruber]|uniref:hypothetical protein n=1 Tax=Spartinivicinus ruber TaxID=2683272 RepID=UPI0013D4F5D0|nr:hypothetical protein [Spartinivicinus ruber]
MKAWECYCDSLESSYVVFANTEAEAREIAIAKQDNDEYYIDVKRVIRFDKFYPQVPPKVLIEEEHWWWRCSNCSQMLGNDIDDDDLDMNDVVYGDDELVFCNSGCQAEYDKKLERMGIK